MAGDISYIKTNVWGDNGLYNERVPIGILDIIKYVNYLKKKGLITNHDEYDKILFTGLKDLQLTLHEQSECEEKQRIEAARIVEAARIAAARIVEAARIEVASSFLNPVATPFKSKMLLLQQQRVLKNFF